MADALALEITPDRIYLRSPFLLKPVCQSVVGGRWDAASKRWYWPNDPLIAGELLDAFGPRLSSLPEAGALRAINAPLCQTNDAGTAAAPGDLPEIPGLTGASWQHQRAGYAFCQVRRGALLAFDMGLGKSRVAVGLVRGRSQFALILCPKSVVAVWPREFSKHLANPEVFIVVPLDRGTVAEKTRAAERHMGTGKRVVLVLNYESAWREPFCSFAMRAGFDTLVMDEAHKIKAPGGKASRFCARLGSRCRFRLALTGTPMPHSPLDIYGIYRTLNPGIFGTNFHQFKTRYAIMGGFESRSVVGYQRQRELHDNFNSIAVRAGKELLDLPPEQDVTIPVTLSPAAMRVLKALERDFYAALENGAITAANALVKLLRQQQVTGGYARYDDGGMEQVDTGKADALEDLLEGMGAEAAVVFTRFTADLDTVAAVCAKLDIRYSELSGRKNQLAEWQSGADDAGQVIGVNIQAGGAGIDLTRARYCIYFSLGFSLGDYMQSRARVHRPGQDRPVTYYHLVAEKTVDVKVYEALAARREVVDHILNGVAFCPELCDNE
jgi:SNF2 family DNA or RNA helicase